MNDETLLPWTIADVLKATGGSLLKAVPERSFAGVSIDSRKTTPDDLFVAIVGRSHDGHSFIEDVLGRGIAGIVLAEEKTQAWLPPRLRKAETACIVVADTTRALGDLAAYHRRRTGVSVVAITGSNGKTTTREMTAAVISQSYTVLATSGNFNNEIGLPLTLLKLNQRHRWAVLELGMNHPGEIRRLTEICLPDIGVITNIGAAHLEGLGTIDGVMRAKGELLEAMSPNSAAVLNADDHRIMKLAGSAPGRMLLFGRSESADIVAGNIRHIGNGSRFQLTTPSGVTTVQIGLPGAYMVSNALAAAAAGHIIEIPLPRIRTGLETVKPVQGRMNIMLTGDGIHLIDDSYNANPGSMAAAIENLCLLSGKQRRVLVAGDMLELGAQARSLHRQIGALAAGAKLSRLYLSGEYAESVSQGAREQGMSAKDIFIGDRREILTHLSDWLRPDDWVLVKGSRAAGMEIIVQGLSGKNHDQV